MLSGDCFPIIYKYARSLDKGDYVIRLHVRHEKAELLEKLKDTYMHVRHQITGTLSQEIHASVQSILKGTSSKKVSSEKIQKNGEKSYFLAPIAEDKLPKGAASGHFLTGELSLFKEASISQVDNHRIVYFLSLNGATKDKKSTDKSAETPPKTAAKSLNEVTSSTLANGEKSVKTKSEDDKFNEALRDIKVAHILK